MKIPPFRFYEWTVLSLKSRLGTYCPLCHAIPFPHCLPDPRTSPNQIFSFSSQFLRNTSHDLLNSIILLCILNLSFPNTYHIYLFNFCLPWLLIKSRTLSAFFTAVKKKTGLWSSLIKLGENGGKENEKTEHLPVSLTPFTFCTYTPTYSNALSLYMEHKGLLLNIYKDIGASHFVHHCILSKNSSINKHYGTPTK